MPHGTKALTVLAGLILAAAAAPAEAQGTPTAAIVGYRYVSDGNPDWTTHFTYPWANGAPEWQSLTRHFYFKPVGGGAPNQWIAAHNYGGFTYPNGVHETYARGNAAYWPDVGVYAYSELRWYSGGQPMYWQSAVVYIDNPNN